MDVNISGNRLGVVSLSAANNDVGTIALRIGATGPVGVQGVQGVQGVALPNWIRVNSNYTANNNDRLIGDTSNGSFNITLPAAPITGTYVQITDGDDWSSNNLVVLRNGSTIESANNDLALNVKNVTVEFIYNGDTWEVTATTGARGTQGPVGVQGATGAGYQGTTGIQGTNGTQGVTGAGSQGTTGIGVQGAQGASGGGGGGNYGDPNVAAYILNNDVATKHNVAFIRDQGFGDVPYFGFVNPDSETFKLQTNISAGELNTDIILIDRQSQNVNVTGNINFSGGAYLVHGQGGPGSIDLVAGPDGWAELQSGDANSYVWVDNNSAYIGTNWTVSPKTWSFTPDGVLILPGNVVPSINNVFSLGSPEYQFKDLFVSNNTIYVGGASLGTDENGRLLWNDDYVTGNVSFDNITVQGQYGLLALSPDSTFTADGQYFRLRGGDDPAHLHFDTNNRDEFDLFLGDDNKYVKLDRAGNVEIRAYDTANGQGYLWNFTANGSVTTPDNLTIGKIDAPINGSVIVQDPNSYLIIAATGQDGVAQLGWAENLNGGNVAGIYFNNNQNGEITLTTGELGNVTHTWTFDAIGNTTFPGNSTLTTSEGAFLTTKTFSGNSYTQQNQDTNTWELYSEDDTTGSYSAWAWIKESLYTVDTPEVFIENKRGSDGVEYRWTFDANGHLILPGSHVTSKLYTDNNGYRLNLEGNNNDIATAKLVLDNDNGHIRLIVGNTVTPAIWAFRDNGDLTLPANTFAVKYANGDYVLLGGGPTGPQGAQGDMGSPGPQGTSGINGTQGTTGGTGPAGPQGTSGTNGTQGTTGGTGPAGPQGTTGTIGPQGITGPIAGSDTQVIFNDGGTSNGAVGLTYTKATGNVAVSGNLRVTQQVQISTTAEAIGSNTTATGTVVFNTTTGQIFNAGPLSANITANFTNVVLAANNAVNYTILINQNTTPFIANVVQLNGVAQTIVWQSATVPVPTASQKEFLNFTVFNISGTWTVFGQLVSF